MLTNLKLKDGASLDIPVTSFLMLEDTKEKGKGCNLVYTLIPTQNDVDELDMSYGFVKKQWTDGGLPRGELLEVTVAGDHPRKVCFPASFVIARRELTENEIGAKTRLTLNVNGKIMNLAVKDKRDTLTGE